MDGFILMDGVVASWAFGRLSAEEVQTHLAEADEVIAQLEMALETAEEPAATKLRDRVTGWSRTREGLLKDRSSEIFTETSHADWPEAVVGQAPGWPRTKRNRLLSESDYVDSPGWRAGKDPTLLAAQDALRAALRALPETYPDPLSIIWPAAGPT